MQKEGKNIIMCYFIKTKIFLALSVVGDFYYEDYKANGCIFCLRLSRQNIFYLRIQWQDVGRSAILSSDE